MKRIDCGTGYVENGGGMKKRVILYGVHKLGLRREIENFLDDSYEIIGCSDGHYKRDIWGERRFIKPEDLCREAFEWILMSALSDESRKEIKRDLVLKGISPKKILSPVLVMSDIEVKTSPDLVADIDVNYHGEKRLMFGLSYSELGIEKRLLKSTFYDFSSLSLDLYYNFRLYSYMERKYGPVSGMQTVLWVFPYYYFDYDMSRSITLHKIGRLFSLWRLDDWHGWELVPEAREYVENYRMFGRKISRFYHAPKPGWKSTHIYEQENGLAELENLWFSDHEETVAENRKIFVQFFRRIEAGGVRPVLVIPPFLIGSLSAVSKEAFFQKKEKFYRILRALEPEIGKLQVFDYADRFADKRELFFDIEHLNETGAQIFTELLNKDVL